MKTASHFASSLLFGVVLLTFQPVSQAGSVNCVPDKGCPEGVGPPDCCQPPPCEFTQALKFARAYRDNLKDIAIGMSFTEDMGATGRDAEMRWAGEMQQVFIDLLDQAAPCPANQFFQDPPLLKVVPEMQCEIMYWADEGNKASPANLEDMKDDVNTCDEILDARWSKARAERDICLAERYGSQGRTLAVRMMQDLAQADAELDSLEAQQRRYESVCTVTPDSGPAQEAVDDDLVPLIAEDDDLVPLTPEPKPKGKKSKRSGKKGGKR